MSHDVAPADESLFATSVDPALLEQALAELESALESACEQRTCAVLEKYPDLSSELESYLGNRRALDQVVVPLHQAARGVSHPPEIDGYRVLQLHDEGGMGFIYRAYYERLKQVVALKVMRDDVPLSDEEKRRFETEARCASDLDHGNIIPVHDIGVEGARPYYAMKLVDGVTLKEKLENDGAFESRAAGKLMLAIAEAMACAHAEGVIHRDLKPGNILIDRHQHPVIIDFGLARREAETDPIEPGNFVGTPLYCSPEQAEFRAHEARAPADVYSLGAILYEMLAGQPPLQGADRAGTLEKVRTQQPLPVSAHAPSVERNLETICMRCLEKNPADRYPNAHELAEDLRRYLKGHALATSQSRHPYFDWLFDQGFEEKISQIGPSLLRFQAVYTACIIGVQILLLLNWGEPLAWLLAFGSLTMLFSILKTDDSHGWLPTNPSERLLWSIWTGAVMAHFLLAVAMRLSLGYVPGFHQTFAVLPFITGMTYFVMGGNFWKQNLAWGVLWMLLGIVTVTSVPLPWAPSVYITFSCACTTHLVIAQLHSAKQRAEKPTALSVTRVLHSD